MADPSNHYKLSPKCVVPTSNLSSLGSPLRANDCVMFEVLTNHLFLLYAAQVILRELQKLSAMVSVCPYLSVTANTLQSYLYIVVHYTLGVTQPTSLYAHTHSTAYTVQIISLYGTSCSTHTQTHAHTHTNTCVRTHTHTHTALGFVPIVLIFAACPVHVPAPMHYHLPHFTAQLLGPFSQCDHCKHMEDSTY